MCYHCFNILNKMEIHLTEQEEKEELEWIKIRNVHLMCGILICIVSGILFCILFVSYFLQNFTGTTYYPDFTFFDMILSVLLLGVCGGTTIHFNYYLGEEQTYYLFQITTFSSVLCILFNLILFILIISSQFNFLALTFILLAIAISMFALLLNLKFQHIGAYNEQYVFYVMNGENKAYRSFREFQREGAPIAIELEYIAPKIPVPDKKEKAENALVGIQATENLNKYESQKAEFSGIPQYTELEDDIIVECSARRKVCAKFDIISPEDKAGKDSIEEELILESSQNKKNKEELLLAKNESKVDKKVEDEPTRVKIPEVAENLAMPPEKVIEKDDILVMDENSKNKKSTNLPVSLEEVKKELKAEEIKKEAEQKPELKEVIIENNKSDEKIKETTLIPPLTENIEEKKESKTEEIKKETEQKPDIKEEKTNVEKIVAAQSDVPPVSEPPKEAKADENIPIKTSEDIKSVEKEHPKIEQKQEEKKNEEVKQDTIQKNVNIKTDEMSPIIQIAESHPEEKKVESEQKEIIEKIEEAKSPQKELSPQAEEEKELKPAEESPLSGKSIEQEEEENKQVSADLSGKKDEKNAGKGQLLKGVLNIASKVIASKQLDSVQEHRTLKENGKVVWKETHAIFAIDCSGIQFYSNLCRVYVWNSMEFCKKGLQKLLK